MKLTLKVFLFCIFSLYASAQSLKGTIKNQAGEGIGFANITVLNSPVGTVADKDGIFSLELSKGKFQLRFSAVGFANKVRTVELADQALTIDDAF